MNNPEETAAYLPEGTDAAAVDDSAHALPQHIGCDWVERLLGKGGFGFVYLAHGLLVQQCASVSSTATANHLLNAPAGQTEVGCAIAKTSR